MKKFALIPIFMVATTALPATADDDLSGMIDLFSDCHGVYTVAGAMYGGAQESAYKELAGGAIMSAAYMLAVEDKKMNPGSQRPVADFLAYAEGRSEVMVNRLAAAAERGDLDIFTAKLNTCVSYSEIQEIVVQQIPADAYQRD